MKTYIVTDFCADPDCCCLHHDGVIIYAGDDLDEALDWLVKSPLYGNTTIEEIDGTFPMCQVY